MSAWRRRWSRRAVALFVAAALSVAALWAINPFNTAARDLGARLWGRLAMPVPDAGMQPTLPPGYQLVVDTRAYRRGAPASGDLLVYLQDRQPRVGRVVAGPGQSVALRLGDLFVNGALQPPIDGLDLATGPGRGRDLDDTPVPPDHVFVLGDARDQATDSRHHGPVPRRRWVGKVVAVRR